MLLLGPPLRLPRGCENRLRSRRSRTPRRPRSRSASASPAPSSLSCARAIRTRTLRPLRAPVEEHGLLPVGEGAGLSSRASMRTITSSRNSSASRVDRLLRQQPAQVAHFACSACLSSRVAPVRGGSGLCSALCPAASTPPALPSEVPRTTWAPVHLLQLSARSRYSNASRTTRGGAWTTPVSWDDGQVRGSPDCSAISARAPVLEGLLVGPEVAVDTPYADEIIDTPAGSRCPFEGQGHVREPAALSCGRGLRRSAPRPIRVTERPCGS